VTQQVVRARVLIPSTVAEMDDCSFGVTLEATGSDPSLDFGTSQTPQAKLEAFINSTVGAQTNPLSYYLSNLFSRASNACSIEWTDITAHLDGSAAGSAFRTDQFTLGTGGGEFPMPPGTNVCAALRADYGATIEHGPLESLPTSESAQDQGAPSTHMGNIRPRGRMRGRLYVGPVNGSVGINNSTGLVSDVLYADMGIAVNGLIDTANTVSANQFNTVCWSRRGATVNPATFYYVNEGFAYQRRRADVTIARVHDWQARS
jgi:hypothetical protein